MNVHFCKVRTTVPHSIYSTSWGVIIYKTVHRVQGLDTKKMRENIGNNENCSV